MSTELLDRLDAWKGRYGSPDTSQLEQLLVRIASERFAGASALIRLHETLLFLRAYPPSRKVARLADAILFAFSRRVSGLQAAGEDPSEFESPEVSGIAGTSLAAVFDYDVARRLSARYPRQVEIAWDRYDESEKLGPVISRFVTLLREDWPVEAHVPYQQWIESARRPGTSDLAWLLERIAALELPPRERAALYESMAVPLLWNIGNSEHSRTRLRLGGRTLHLHREPLLRRGDVSLASELNGPALPVRRVPKPETRKILDVILDTSAMRFRELYGFSHPDENAVFHCDLGRGVEMYFCGVPPAWRLPLRAYHAGMFFKNGVPAGYVELLSLFERAEVGFNLYYTFREGESAWLYARILRLFRQVLGVTCFSVDPYQIGHQNPEAVDSGAFWFYRKLGFRPVDPQVAALVAREEKRIATTKGYRSSRATLEKLADGYLLYSSAPDSGKAWDSFRIRNVGLAVARCSVKSASDLDAVLSLIPEFAHWTGKEKAAAAKILRAKERESEARYLHLMQRHAPLRAAFLKLGCA